MSSLMIQLLIIVFSISFKHILSDHFNVYTNDTHVIRNLRYNTNKHQQKGAAYMLVSDGWSTTRDGRYCYFNKSMDALEQYWHHSNKYPIILLNHQKEGWSKNDIVEIRNRWPLLDIMFASINKIFNTPPVSDKFEDAKKELAPIDYKRMIAFQMRWFAEVPVLKRYRYLMRIDDDSCLLDYINYDIFDEMMHARAVHAYSALFIDPADVVVGLNDFVDNYMTKNRLKYANPALRKASLKYGKEVPAFYGNLEIIDTKRYLQHDIQQFVQALIKSNMIYHRRWGDSPLRFAIAEMFYTKDEVMRLCEFRYQHSVWLPTAMCEHRTTDDVLVKHLASGETGM